ncbi:hypothetical protein ACJJTC_003586 [Scirpophaga incertulas]
MTSQKERHDVTGTEEVKVKETTSEVRNLPPSGTSLHKRRRGEPPAYLSVKAPLTPSDAEGSSPCTAAVTPDDIRLFTDTETPDPETLCDGMLQRLKDCDDPLSRRGQDLARRTKYTMETLDQLEKILELLDQFLTLKDHNAKLSKKINDVNHLKKLYSVHKKIHSENERLKAETKDLDALNDLLDADLELDDNNEIFESMTTSGKGMKRTGSKWKTHSKFGGTLLRKQRSRSAGGDESDAPPGTPVRRRSEGVFCKEVEKSKISKWTRVKAAFRWEKAQWHPSTMGGAVGAVAAGAMVGAVALAGSAPASASIPHPEPRDSASLTPGSALSLTPDSSCEELRMDSGVPRKSATLDMESAFLQAPMQDDSSTSPSPNNLHRSPWGKMRDMLQPHRESVRKKPRPKGSPDVVPRRRSFSDGADSDAPPALTLTIPSSEELESEPSHPILRKQRSLELGARPPLHRAPRASKWTKVKRAFLTSASASVPSSPSRHSAFFTDAETEGLSSGCEASAVREEIARDYAALQSRLGREFSDRRGKLYAASRPVATEEQLSADFRKKLAEWQRMKGVRQPPPVPARQDLSEDFLKKWDEWKRMKETNSVPAWEEEAKPDEVLVQTSTGLFKFQGISRSFTRKLHEWEKSRGIAPEASTSALLRAARARAPLARAQSAGSVARPADHDDLDSDSDNDGDVDHELECADEYDGVRGAVLVEVEADEVCTAAPLMAVSPRHTPQKPVYTYGQAEARLLCETKATVTGTAVLQPNPSDARRIKTKEKCEDKLKSRSQNKCSENNARKKILRQPSIEEDAMVIRKTIEEVERGSSARFKEPVIESKHSVYENNKSDRDMPSTSRGHLQGINRQLSVSKDNEECKDELYDENKKTKDADKSNGKKKAKSRARLEREQSKPSESDTEQDVDTVTVEIPRRRKRPRKPSERPKTPPLTHYPSDSDAEVFVLKLKAQELRNCSPEVIVKTTRKIFSPVVRSGESVPTAVIPLDVDDLAQVTPTIEHSLHNNSGTKKTSTKCDKVINDESKSKGSGELYDGDDQRPRSRPPLPSSPSSQRKPQSKETAPSIRIMIQRYNMKINEEGHTSGASSGASSPAWRSPIAERRRPLDMPVGVNIRNNPFLEREVQKSASASQLSRRDQSSIEKRLEPLPSVGVDGVLKSHSANALHPEKSRTISSSLLQQEKDDSLETIRYAAASTDTIVPDLTRNLPESRNDLSPQSFPVFRQLSDVIVPSISKFIEDNPRIYDRSVSEADAIAINLTERAARIREARERFLSSTVPMRRDGTSSTSDLRPGDRSSRISCESDLTESQSSGTPESGLGRSASTGMVNVDREAWQRVAEGSRGRSARPRARFSLARLAAKLRRKEDGAVSSLCRQSLLVQLKNKH